jgi:hypothetical protein
MPGSRAPQDSPNPVATPKGCQGNTQNQTRIYLRPRLNIIRKCRKILNKSMSQGPEISILQSLGLLVHPSSIQVTKKYQRTCHKTAKGCRGRPQKSRDSDQKPLKSVLGTDIVRSRQTGVHKIVPRPQNIGFRSRGSAIQQHCTDPEKTRKSNPKWSRSAPKWHLSWTISASLGAIESRCLQDRP